MNNKWQCIACDTELTEEDIKEYKIVFETEDPDNMDFILCIECLKDLF